MERQDAIYASIAAIVSGLFISFVLHDSASVPNIYSDIGSFWSRCWVKDGVVPYLSSSVCNAGPGQSLTDSGTAFEYPVLSGLLLYAVRIVGGDQTGYYYAFGVASLAAGIVLAWSAWMITRKLGRRLNPLYFMLPSILVYGIYNFDLFHAALVMLSIQAFLYGRRGTSALMLGLAISMKLVSAVLLPIFFIEMLAPRSSPGSSWNWKAGITYAATTAGVFVVLNLPFMVGNFGNWFYTYSYLKDWGLENAWYGWIFQSPACSVSSSCATWAYAKIFGLVLTTVLLLRVYTLRVDVTTKAFLALASYLLGTYIYAPQFNVLLIPLIAVLTVEHPSVYLWDTFNVMIILTWFIPTPLPTSICPSGSCPTLPWTLPQEFALGRAVMLAWMALWVVRMRGWNIRSMLPFQRQKTLDPSLPHDE